jgi:hypothetical protein
LLSLIRFMIAMTTDANAASTAAPQEQERVREEEVAKSRLDGHLALKRPTACAVGNTPDRGAAGGETERL